MCQWYWMQSFAFSFRLWWWSEQCRHPLDCWCGQFDRECKRNRLRRDRTDSFRRVVFAFNGIENLCIWIEFMASHACLSHPFDLFQVFYWDIISFLIIRLKNASLFPKWQHENLVSDHSIATVLCLIHETRHKHDQDLLLYNVYAQLNTIRLFE